VINHTVQYRDHQINQRYTEGTVFAWIFMHNDYDLEDPRTGEARNLLSALESIDTMIEENPEWYV